METNNAPKDGNEIDPKKVTNQSDKIVNKEIPHEHEATNEEQWVHDVNEEFGDDYVLPEEEDEDDELN
ncbi:MAG TPA: hypothetical protein VL125_03435 [Pelobium sp.]|nr:hypothetical protein [Pelobium sp.]